MAAKKTVIKSMSNIPTAKKATAGAITKFEEGFNKSMGVSLRLGARRKKPKIVSTGSLNLDFALTTGGIPGSRTVKRAPPSGESPMSIEPPLLNVTVALPPPVAFATCSIPVVTPAFAFAPLMPVAAAVVSDPMVAAL